MPNKDFETNRWTRRSTIKLAAAGAIVPSLAEASTTNPFIVVDPSGNGDYTDLMAAVRAAAPGSTVFIRQGTYTVTDSLQPARAVRLLGEGYSTVIQAGANLQKNVIFIQNDYVVIENLRIDGNQSNQTIGPGKSNIDYNVGTGGRVLNCWVHDAAGYNIVAFSNVTDLVISGNRCYSSPQEGIELQGASHCTVVGNVCKGNGNGINLWNSSGDCHHNTVVGNTIHDSAGYGIVLQDGAHENTVTGNAVDTSGKDGILVEGWGNGVPNPSTANVVSDNVVSHSGASGIRLNGPVDTMLSNNSLRSNGQHGIWLRYGDGCAVLGNTLLANKGSGIRIEGFPDRPARNVNIEGNTARSNGQDTSLGGDGIELIGPLNRIAVTANMCFDSQATKTQRNGISLGGSTSTIDNVLFNANLVDGNRDTGMAISSAAGRTQNVPFRKVAATVGPSQVSVPHGLPYTPQAMTITMRSPGTVWQSAPSDATNVYLTADAPSRQVDVIAG
jgi:parallel beta-helix repeat protein